MARNFLDDQSAAEADAAQLAVLEQRCCVIQGDISQPEEVWRLVATAKRKLGPLDVLVNNAGIFPRAPFLDLTEETWDAVLDTNLKGTFVCAQAVARRMVAAQRPGVIINFLQDNPDRLRGAHSIAGDFYARHFRARQIVSGGRLGGDFVEARFHLVQAGRQEDLREIVGAFEMHLKTEITATSRTPRDPHALDERIAVVSALLGEGGAKSLEYHLA